MTAPTTIEHVRKISVAEESAASLPMTRRRVLHVIGGAGAMVAVAAVGGGALRAVDQGVFASGDGPAYAAWNQAPGTSGDGAINLVRAAVLAANAHDAQPWLFKVGADRIDLFSDPLRNLGSVDPFGRELMISLGCALENLTLAAGPNGFAATPALFPDPADPTHIARLDLTAIPPTQSALFDAIPNRHTNRAAYHDTPVTAETLAAMASLNDAADVAVIWLDSPELKQSFNTVTVAATEAFIADTEQSVEDFAWWRGDWEELQRHKDGITIDAAGLPPLTRALGKLMPDISRATSDSTWLSNTKNTQLSNSAAFGIIVALDHRSDAQRLQTGRLYQRLHLWATGNRLAMQPLNQSVERRDRELQRNLEPVTGRPLDALMPDPKWQAVMPFRIGYPAETALASPRRPAADVVRA